MRQANSELLVGAILHSKFSICGTELTAVNLLNY
jgi:hypothetical protein